jgi:hypothetical protein
MQRDDRVRWSVSDRVFVMPSHCSWQRVCNCQYRSFRTIVELASCRFVSFLLGFFCSDALLPIVCSISRL